MSEADDDAEWAELSQELIDAPEDERAPIRARMTEITNRRAAERVASEHEMETLGIVDAFGSDPAPGVAVEDGGTLHRLPVHVDAETGWISGGSLDHNRPPWLPPF